MAKESVENQSESTSDIEAIPRVSGGLIEQNALTLPIEEDITDQKEREERGDQPVASERRQIAKSASLVMLGNLGSSVLGMVRQIVVTALGPSIAGPFNASLLPART